MSGIYISGLQMPQNCLECTFYRKTDPIYDYCCISSAVPKGYVPEDCPLVPVPDHGDLVDRQELLKEQLPLMDGSQRITAVRVMDICSAKVFIPADEGEG